MPRSKADDNPVSRCWPVELEQYRPRQLCDQSRGVADYEGVDMANRTKPDLAQRFWAKVAKTSDSECWIWTAFTDKNGYGRIREGGRTTQVLYAHRYSYEQAKGPIPKGLVIDHLCRNRACVNPAHLEAVTDRVNIERGESPSTVGRRTGKCKNGHYLGFYVTKKYGERAYCRVCQNEKRRKPKVEVK